jgi:hypothetical protein
MDYQPSGYKKQKQAPSETSKNSADNFQNLVDCVHKDNTKEALYKLENNKIKPNKETMKKRMEKRFK